MSHYVITAVYYYEGEEVIAVYDDEKTAIIEANAYVKLSKANGASFDGIIVRRFNGSDSETIQSWS